jgi:hypothetical protein
MTPKKLALAVSTLLSLGAAAPLLAGSIEFDEVPVPTSDVEKRLILASDYAIVDGKKVYIDYNTILRSGDKPQRGRGAGVFGQLYDIDGRKLRAEDGSKLISNDNDFSSLLTGDDGRLYMVSHFEARPGALYLTQLEQKRRSGELVARKTRILDMAELNGGWVHCAGSVTPWGTHLGSEEYEPDAKQWRDGTISDYNAQMAVYFGADPAEAISVMNPYDYGYPVEVKVTNFRKAKVEKHYAMGRIALELAYVMPDNKTAYLTDDGTNVGLFKFVADQAELDQPGPCNRRAGQGLDRRIQVCRHLRRGRTQCRRHLRRRLHLDQRRARGRRPPVPDAAGREWRRRHRHRRRDHRLAPGDPPLGGHGGWHHRVPQDGGHHLRSGPRPVVPGDVRGGSRHARQHARRPGRLSDTGFV